MGERKVSRERRPLRGVQIRVAVEDYNRIAAAAAKLDVSVSIYFRDMVRRELAVLDIVASDREHAKTWADQIVGGARRTASTPPGKTVRKLSLREMGESS